MRNGKTLRLYKSYRFSRKDPIIAKVKAVVDEEGETQAFIHRESGVATTTIHNWFKGPTRCPQFASLNAVLRTLGKEFKITNR